MSEWKQPSERLVFTYDFTNQLGAATIVSVDAVTQAARGSGAALTEVSPRVNDTKKVQITWEGGADGETYRTTVKITDSDGQKYEQDGEIAVLDLTFELPAGITSTYITAEEYVARFGIAETIGLTDQLGTETVGEALGEALGDAGARIEGYVAARYTLPLTTVPALLKTIAADLARERLFTNHPTDEVTKRADQARKDLADISKGTLVLVAADAVVADTAADEPAIYMPDEIFTDELLSSYRGWMQ